MNKQSYTLKRIGEKHITKEGYEVEIIDHPASDNYTLKFTYNEFIMNNRNYSEIINGGIKNPYHKSIFGVGYMGGLQSDGTYELYKKCYRIWRSMLCRCYDPSSQEKSPTYIGITVCNEWHNFQNFKKWFEENCIENFHLDKDIICRDCKMYSPETCCFVPQEINSLFTKRKNHRGRFPIGVIKHKNKYRSRLGRDRKHLGLFTSIKEAFEAYKTAKEYQIKEVAEKWKDEIDPRVYEAMMEYEVKETD